MKKIILNILIIFITSSLFPSTTKIDSLENVLKTISGNEKVCLLNELSKEYLKISVEKSLEYSTQALELAEKLENNKEKANALSNLALGNYYLGNNNKALEYYELSLIIEKEIKNSKRIAAILNNLGIICSNLNDYDKALEYYLKSLQIYEKIDDKKYIAITLNNIGTVYEDLSNYDKALEYHLKSLKIRNEIGDKNSIANCVNNIGIIYDAWGNYEKALEYYLQSLKIYEELENKNGIANSLDNIGTVYKNLNNYDNALEYHLKSLQIREEIRDKNGIAASLNNIGVAYKNLSNYNKALEYYLSSLKIFEEIGDKRSIAASFNNIGNVYCSLDNYNKALEYLLKSISIKEEIGDKFGMANSSNNIGSLYLKLENYDKAVLFLGQGMKLAQEIEADNILQESYMYLSELYTAQNNFQKALDYYILYSSIKDSMFNKESDKHIAEMQTKYETEKKEKEISLLQKNNEIQKLEVEKHKLVQMRLVFILLIIVILWFFIFYYYRSKQKLNKELKKLVAERTKELTESNIQLKDEISERKKLEAQLRISERLAGIGELASGVAHEIRNPLAVISSTVQYLNSIYKDTDNEMVELLEIINQSSEQANSAITSLLEFAKPREISLIEGDILKSIFKVCSLVETKCSTQKVQLITKLPHKLPNILYDEHQMEGVFLNLILNSLSAMPEGGKLIISAEGNNSEVEINISDTGVGISEENLQKVFNPFFTTKKGGTGLGLSFVHQVVHSLQGSLTINSKIGEGTSIILTFQVCSN
ncbi:MAG: tetratricopeptide repeat protein [Candidatus Cloacimonetes bacterium]|nr:tetratricopeptide repeat protein [Candidatus Cloacimonadota bacterium]